MAATEARFVLLVLITYREQWAREQDQHRHGEENQNVVVYTFASICQRVLPRPHCSPWKARFTIARVPPCEIFRLYLAKTQPVVHLRITTRIARMLRHRISLSLSLSLPASLRTESNFYTISISLLALILVSFSCDCNFTIVQQFLYFWISWNYDWVINRGNLSELWINI